MLIGTSFVKNNVGITGIDPLPTIKIYQLNPLLLVINGASMVEIGDGGYDYDFAVWNAGKAYYWRADAGASVGTPWRYRRGWSGVLGSIPDAQAGVTGGLPLVDANNYIAGIQGTKNTFDDLVDITLAQVKAQIVAALYTDTYGEPGQGEPPSTTSLVNKIGYPYKFFINKNTRSRTHIRLYNAAGNVIDQKASILDVNEIFTKGKLESGP